MNAVGLVLHHGWGFDATALESLATKLREITPYVHSLDAGFFVDTLQQQPIVPLCWPPSLSLIAVGHSFGFATLLQKRGISWSAAVSIAGFTHMLSTVSGMPGVTTEEFAALAAGLREEPTICLGDFHRRCGLPPRLRHRLPTAPSLHGLFRLAEALHDLAHLALRMPDIPILALAARRDRIVPPTLTEACFSSSSERRRLLWHPTAPHALGLIEVDWCRTAIATFIESTFCDGDAA